MALTLRRPGLAGLTLLVCLATLLPCFAAVVAAETFASPDFQTRWNRTDKQVAAGSVSRTFMWGPEPFTSGLQEDYQESPGGKRLVQYFDKSRMEINNPAGDKTNPFYVTNGLLTRELMSGQMQVGHNKFVTRQPATVGVAGDVDDTSGPTYQTFKNLTFAVTAAEGQPVVRAINRAGQQRDGTAEFGKYNVTQVKFEALTGHNIARPFWDFLNTTGPVLDAAGKTVTGRIFEPVYYATGLPVTEAWWARVKVGGKLKDVLVQAFERRVLTYTPENPAGFQVEMGNVGRHYYDWRYKAAPPPPPVNCAALAMPPNTGGVQVYPWCGPAGLDLAFEVKMSPNEAVQATLVFSDGHTEPVENIQADANGLLSQTVYTLPTDPQGQTIIKLKGMSSGKEATGYFYLLPPVAGPTILVTPNPVKVSSTVAIVIVGFRPDERLRLTLRTAQPGGGDNLREAEAGKGGGVTRFFKPNEVALSEPVAGEWTVTATSVVDPTRTVTVKFTVQN